MADARAKAVFNNLVDNWTRAVYAHDMAVDLGPAVAKGDSIDIPSQAKPTNRSATVRAAPETLTPTVTTLNVDQEVFYNVNIPPRDEAQLINGRWPAQTAMAGMRFIRNEMDDAFLSFLTKTVAWDVNGTYHHNIGGAALTDDVMSEVEAASLAADGYARNDLSWMVSSYGAGAMRAIADYVPNGAGSERGRLGIPQVTAVNGVPVFISNGIVRNISVAILSSAILTNVLTLTVDAGHGVVPGMVVSTSGLTANEAAAVVTSVTATTIVMATTAGDDATNGAGTLAGNSSMNLILDMSKIYFARQIMPRVETRKDFESPAHGLQFYSCFGYEAIPGAVRVLHSPGSAVS